MKKNCPYPSVSPDELNSDEQKANRQATSRPMRAKRQVNSTYRLNRWG